MLRNTLLASLLASGAITAALAGSAQAGEMERAREAIAAADAKIHTAESLGAATELPGATDEAKAVLAHARADFASGHRDRAIEDAARASALADNTIGELKHRHDQALAATAAAAHDSVAQAQDQTAAAEQQAAAARQQAADANARAEAAEQQAAQSAADAEAARTAAAVAQSQQAQAQQVETTVTTQHTGAAAHKSTKTRVVRRKTTAAPTTTTDQVTTTTSVGPQ